MPWKPLAPASFGLALVACAGAPEPAPRAPAPEASAPTPPAAKPPPPATPAELAVFAEGWGLDVATIADAAVLYDRSAGGWAKVAGDEVAVDRDAFAGLDAGRRARVIGLGGASATRPVAHVRGDATRLHARDGAAWRLAATLRAPAGTRVDLVPAAGDATLAAVITPGGAALVPVRSGEAADVRLEGARAQALPASFKAFAAVGTGGGEVVFVGARDDGPEAGPAAAVARLAPGAVTATVEPLPGGPGTNDFGWPDATICHRDGVGTFVVRVALADDQQPHAYAVAWKGGAWTLASERSPAIPWRAVGCAVAPDGSVWLATGPAAGGPGLASAVLRLDARGAWTPVKLPSLPTLTTRPRLRDAAGGGPAEIEAVPLSGAPGFVATGVRSTAAGDVFVTGVRAAGADEVRVEGAAWREARTVVLRSGPARAGGPVAWDSVAGDAIARLAGERGATPPAPAKNRADKDAPVRRASLPPSKPDCSWNFVALQDVAAGADDDGFPALRAAIADQPALGLATFLVGDLGDRRVVGARAPSYAFAKALAEHVRVKVPGTKPGVYCGDPGVVRVVPMEVPVSGARGLSPVPTPEEWDGARECVVRGSSAASCETKRVRDWVRVVCKGKNDKGGTVESVSIDRGAAPGEAFAFGRKGFAMLVYPYAPGTDFAATFRFADHARTLTSTWPAGKPMPSVVGEMK